MKCRKILIMMVLAIFIFGMASVCASEGDDAVIAGEDNPAVELSQAGTYEIISTDGNELLGQTENDGLISEGNSGTFAELQANITAAKQGSTITLTKNYERESGFDVEGIVIGKSITIDGNGFKIDAQGNSRILKITADNVILKNIIFTNGKTTENGGAVFFQKSGTVTNCSFINNHNGEGAVFFVGKGEVTNSNFADNYADYGAAIYFSDSGNVTNCNFTDNLAAKDGGAVYFQNSGDVRDCNFIKSTSKNNGGAVFFEKSGTVINCNFADSTASNTGGAVYFSSEGKVTDCSFDDSSAAKYGGAVYFTSDGDVANCNFANNTAKMGNAIYSNSKCTVSDCDFTDNPLTKGAIHSVTGDITLSNNVIDVDDVVKGRNFTEIQKLIDRANDGDEITIDGLYEGFGIPIRITKSLTLIGQNNATLDARKLSKILYITADNVILKNIQFTNGYADNEGAVYFYRTGTVENCNFNNNEVTGEKGSGGAIYFNGAGNVINSIFTANKATRNGGAVYVESQSINNNFSSQFYNNYAGQSGGAIFFHNLVQNNNFECIFEDNYAGYGAGMFFSKNANANRFNSDFINNTAKSCGGAMFFYSTTDKNNFTGSFINNSALGQIDPANGNGGAITFKNVSTNSIFTCDFINNTASLNGGAVNYRETPKNIIFNANFTNNAAQRGGGVNFFKTFEDVIFNGELSENSAENGGALAAGYGTVKDISFNNNHANNGGAVYFAGSGLTVNCNFTNNSAAHNGGAVYISEKGNVVNCSFEDNTAAHDGGAVYSKSGTVENCNFTDNAAKNNGGAVSLSYPSNVANCHFADNSAKNGGALYFLNDNDNVINCSFVANEADSRGGAIFFMTKQQVNATNCYFEANSAPEGGAIFCYTWAVTADSIILKTDSDTTNNTLILSPKLDVYDFYSVYGSGENLTFDLTTHGGMPITNGNISMAIYFKDNAKEVANYTFLSGEDWTVDLPVGSYYALINTEYEEFEPIFRTIVITMPDVQFYVNVTSLTTSSKTVNITAKSDIPKNLLWDGKLMFILPDGTEINATYGADGTWWAVHTFDDYGEYEVNAAFPGLDKVTVNKGTIAVTAPEHTFWFLNYTINSNSDAVINLNNDFYFDSDYDTAFAEGIMIERPVTINGNGYTIDAKGQARIFQVISADVVLENITFINGHSTGGGAVYFEDTGIVSDCNFTNNTATGNDGFGGAVYFLNNGEVTYCNFTGNNATAGSAIYFRTASTNKNVSHSCFLNNRANAEALEITKYDNNITIIFTGQNNLLNAIYSKDDEVTFTNVTYWGTNGIANTGSSPAVPSRFNRQAGINIAVEGVVNGVPVVNGVNVTDEDGKIVLNINDGDDYYLFVRHEADSYYTEVEKTISNNINVNVTSKTTNNRAVNITAKSNIYSEFMPGKLLFILPNGTQIDATYGADGTWWAVHTFDDYGEYEVNASYIGLDNVTVNNGIITINKADSKITLENVTLDYGDSTNLTVTTAGAVGITANINGVNVTVINNYTIQISDLKAGNHTLTVITIPDDDHNPVSATSKITVNKVDSTLTVRDIVFDYGSSGSGDVSFTGANEVIANVISQPKAVVSVSGKKITVSGLAAGTYTLNVSTVSDENHNAVTKTSTITVNKVKSTLTLNNIELDYGSSVNVTVSAKGATGITAKIDGVNADVNAYTISISDLSVGNHTLTVTTVPDENHSAVTKTATITVNKVSTKLAAAGVTATYKVNKYLVIKLTDGQGNPLANSTMTVNLNGAKKYTTNENGQVKIKVSTMVPKTYSAKISYAGNDTYAESSATAKVVVKKATPKVTANAKTFKTTTKTKKYAIILKDNTGKAINNAKVTLKVNGKTYKATTNSKGKATFKITKLTKKGTFKATITYKGNKYYSKVTKKASIKVISTWKTISKGSKEKSTVKQIQRALKNHGYYLTHQGHSLVVDGIYGDYTVRAVKEFQKAKGLKVTGKVDEKTAKKLGLI
ncbi:MAG: peptidoglycan-binding protein [Methanobrevibacter sp.]|nr:peptidoglycan-binding protein [Methanobrevibacter sp.]